MLIVSFASFSAVLTLKIYHKGDEGQPVPSIIQLIFFKFIARFVLVRNDV